MTVGCGAVVGVGVVGQGRVSRRVGAGEKKDTAVSIGVGGPIGARGPVRGD